MIEIGPKSLSLTNYYEFDRKLLSAEGTDGWPSEHGSGFMTQDPLMHLEGRAKEKTFEFFKSGGGYFEN